MHPADLFDGHDLGVAATRFHRAMKQSVATALEPFGLTGAAYGALHFIDGHDEPSNTALARYLIITPQALGRLTAQLEGEGLMVRRRAGKSLRYSLALTVEGARRMSAAQPAVESHPQVLRSAWVTSFFWGHASSMSGQPSLSESSALMR